ncbi:hypothetical protein C8J57DRAFT_1529488 [Mycena rebaudengoi]|nr:hypothetical protein C8J57DRAFT_1529488 [Mycena rebaudengoi]
MHHIIRRQLDPSGSSFPPSLPTLHQHQPRVSRTHGLIMSGKSRIACASPPSCLQALAERRACVVRAVPDEAQARELKDAAFAREQGPDVSGVGEVRDEGGGEEEVAEER